jgi:hypothetical protein
MNLILAPRLKSGGLISTYRCSASCAHCLYVCNPERRNEYFNPTLASQSLQLLSRLGVKSLHIGGGEPFLSREGLEGLFRVFTENRMGIDYVETNASWASDPEKTAKLLMYLKTFGLRCVLVSLSPWHNEFVPFQNAKNVAAACDKTGIRFLPWKESCIPSLKKFDPHKTVTLAQYAKEFGKDSLFEAAEDYGVVYRGRAVKLQKRPKRSAEKIATANPGPCTELFDATHFHVDLFGRFIPGLCTGLGLPLEEAEKPLDPDRFPSLFCLAAGGIGELLAWAVSEFGFVPETGYTGKCALCQAIRIFLFNSRKYAWEDLHPSEFYDLLGKEGYGLPKKAVKKA